MEAFTLLKYWKAGGGATDPFLPSSRAAATTILTATAASDDDDDEEEEDNDDFFDLEFAVPDAAPEEDSDAEDDVAEGEEEDDRTTVSPSESESLFFKGRLVVPVEDPASEPNSKPPPPPPPPPPPAHQLPSLTKFRVFLLGLKKPKLEAQQKPEDDVPRNGKLFTVKFKVDEVPLVSLFSSSRKGTETTPVNEDRRFSKEGVQRYLKKVKPLYVKVSKLRSSISGAGDGKVVEKQVSLGKSRSGSSSAVSSPAAADLVAGGGGFVSKRRDDSLLLQQDGIQGAILHCKRSFNASRDLGACLLLPRSSSDTASHEKLTELLSRKPSDCHGGGK